MPYYLIDSIQYKKEKDTYYVFKGNEEQEVKLNFGFKIAKDLLEFLHAEHSGDEEVITLFIFYQNERLSFFIKPGSNESLESIKQRMTTCTWKTVDTSLDLSFAKSKVVLRGSVTPLVLNERDENLLDELVKGFQHETFLLQVKLGIKKQAELKAQIKLLEETINQLSEQSTTQIGEQGHLAENLKKTIFGGENLSYQQRNIKAQQQAELLENHLLALKTQGVVFKSAEYTIYGNEKVVHQMAAHLKSFSRRSGSMQYHHLSERDKAPLDYLNYVPVNHVAAIIALPISGIPGIHVDKRITFGVDVRHHSNGNGLKLGKLITHQKTNLQVTIPFEDLTKHTFISGVTGSGKTSTIKSMLLQSFRNRVPFLVLEPAKTEYKYMNQEIAGLKVYTLGIESDNSFKLNPFYFPEGIHLQTHLDHLKSVFVAAFPMYGPMPYILETALFSIYRRKGWDFMSGGNIYEGMIEREELFPTLEDLYLEIDDAIENIGYSQDFSSDVRGALKVRIGSLLSGAKGSMLNNRKGHSIDQLLQYPTIIELEYIGDDQEKVFLMGLLLISIYENYISKGEYTSSLKHLFVIEEAHRLLENTAASNNNEVADMKGKAVETFNNILSEIRAYGQGLIVADQIPTKLSPDIIKNTNLKIIHRMFSKEDRETVGYSIGLEDEEIKDVIKLKQGEAIVFHGDLDTAMKANIEVDHSILAANQLPQRPVKRRNQINIHSYILQDEDLRVQVYKLIHTACVFNNVPERIDKILLQMIQEKMGNLPNKLFSLHEFWVETLFKFITEAKLDRFVSYDKILLLQKQLTVSDVPIVDLLAWIKANFKEPITHKMQRLAPLYAGVSMLKQMKPAPDQKLILLFQQRGQKLAYMGDQATELILSHSNIGDIVELSVLNREERRELVSALVLYEFRNNSIILEHFFEFEPLLDN